MYHEKVTDLRISLGRWGLNLVYLVLQGGFRIYMSQKSEGRKSSV